MANLKDLIVNGSARVLGTLYANDIRNTNRVTEFIVGTQAATTGSWTGVTKDDSLYDGKCIHYFLPYAGNGNATLNLTLSNGTTTGAKPVYRWGTSYVTTHYPVNSCINMTYNATKGAWFVDADYDTNNYDRLIHSNNIYTLEALTGGKLICGTKDGYKNVAANVSFDISYPILRMGSNKDASVETGDVYLDFPGTNLQTTKASWTGTKKSMAYLVGTLNGSTFTIDSSVFTTTVPTTEDGKVYMPIGILYSTYQCYFTSCKDLYAYTNGSFQRLGGGSEGGGSSRNIGEIVASTIPLTDAGLHLLDGSLISGSGSYSDFVDYIANLYEDDPTANYFSQPCSEYISETSVGTVISGGNYSGQPATSAFDGNTTTFWGSAQTGSNITGNAYIGRSDLTNPVKKVRMYQGYSAATANYCTNFKFQYSNNGSTWIDIQAVTNGADKTWQEWILPSYTPTGSTHSFRILANGGFSGSSSNNWVVDELELYYQVDYTAEEAWQKSVIDYGVCGKFVYDSTNNTVRLPKYSSKIYTGGGEASVKGNGNCLGLSDGTKTGSLLYYSTNNFTLYRTALAGSPLGSPYPTSTDSLAANVGYGITTDATKSGIIADLSEITTSLDGYYYIVVATSTKTQIQVDIDEIATDLNGKADVDLTNCTKPHIVETYVNGKSWYRVYSDGWCEQGGITNSINSGNYTQITLLKNYKDTDYAFQLDVEFNNNQGYASVYDNYVNYPKTTSSFYAYLYLVGNSTAKILWQTQGYIS